MPRLVMSTIAREPSESLRRQALRAVGLGLTPLPVGVKVESRLFLNP